MSVCGTRADDPTAHKISLTPVMLNKLRCHTHFKFSAKQNIDNSKSKGPDNFV